MCKQLTCIGKFIYSQRVRISTLFTFALHFFDIVTDIIVTDELYKEGSEYFSVSLGILIFSFTSSALLSLDNPWFTELTASESRREKMRFIDSLSFLFKFILFIVIDVLQLRYIMSSIIKIVANRYIDRDLTYSFVEISLVQKRINESLLESGPESLFQLFIILKQSTSKGFNELFIYYSSVLVSLLSLSNTLISIENNYPNSTKKECIRDKYISNTSKYMLTICIYRITEVFSRIGLLACIGAMYDGNILFILLGVDYIFMNLLNIIKRCIRWYVEDCRYSMIVLEEFDEKYKINIKEQTKFKNRLMAGLLMDSAFKIQHAWRKKTNKLHIHIKKRIQNYNKYVYTCSYHWDRYEIEELLKNDIRTNIITNIEIYEKIFSVKYSLKDSSYILRKFGDKININKENDELQLKKVTDLIKYNKTKISSLSVEFYGMIANSLLNIRYIGVYYKSFLQSNEREIYLSGVKNRYKERGFKINYPSKKYWWNRYSMFFISRYINHFIISILLIYKLSVNSYSTTILFISTSSIICYFINIIIYSYIRYFITTKNKYDPIYRKPLINFKCKCKCKKLKDISDNTVNV